MSLIACAKCSRLVREGEGEECRFCSAPMPAPRAALRGRFSRSALLLSAAVVVTGEFPNPFRACESSVAPAYGAPPVAVYGGPPPPPTPTITAPVAPDAGVGDATAPRKDGGKPLK